MTTAAEAVRDLAAEPRYVGAQVGLLAVLHTWNGALHHHPHVHLLVTGGGVTDDGRTWQAARHRFLVPVKKLSRRIAQRFADALRSDHPELFDQVPAAVWKRPWCAYCKPCGQGTDAVLGYLARYVFRIALTNARLLAMDDTHVTFRHKVRCTGRWKTERLPGVDFLRRFLLHVLPKGFHKVRYYGLWHPARQLQQERARLLLHLSPSAAVAPAPRHVADLAEEALVRSDMEVHAYQVTCPRCGGRHLTRLQRLRRQPATMPK